MGDNLVAIEIDKHADLHVGSQVSLAIDPNPIHIFDAATGYSLVPAL